MQVARPWCWQRSAWPQLTVIKELPGLRYNPWFEVFSLNHLIPGSPARLTETCKEKP